MVEQLSQSCSQDLSCFVFYYKLIFGFMPILAISK
jgi:hypothetical protein